MGDAYARTHLPQAWQKPAPGSQKGLSSLWTRAGAGDCLKTQERHRQQPVYRSWDVVSKQVTVSCKVLIPSVMKSVCHHLFLVQQAWFVPCSNHPNENGLCSLAQRGMLPVSLFSRQTLAGRKRKNLFGLFRKYLSQKASSLYRFERPTEPR